jgi:putative transposase
MLKNRKQSSTKYYHELKSVVSKSLISKYQKNRRCKSVRNVSIQVCSDKGTQAKFDSTTNSIRVPAVLGKNSIKVLPLKPVLFLASIEFFKKQKRWYLSYTYYTPTSSIKTTGFLGVDRNARGNVAAMADLESGYAARLGPDVVPWKENIKNRKAKLQSKKEVVANRFLVKLNRKQSNKTKDINHKVSKQIVDYAVEHRKAIVLEDLGHIKSSKKCGHYVQKTNWSFFQLAIFIAYKAALHGIPVIYVNPAYTSKTCSRCGFINVVDGKRFKCKSCGHEDHRDVNAAFNIGIRGKLSYVFNGLTSNERELLAGCIDAPLN